MPTRDDQRVKDYISSFFCVPRAFPVSLGTCPHKLSSMGPSQLANQNDNPINSILANGSDSIYMLVWQCHKPSPIYHHFHGWDSYHQKLGWFIIAIPICNNEMFCGFLSAQSLKIHTHPEKFEILLIECVFRCWPVWGYINNPRASVWMHVCCLKCQLNHQKLYR